MNEPEIRWLYPTSTARKPHAFMPLAEGDDDVERGIQSLCRQYGRFLGDPGWIPPHGGFPGDACNSCAERARKRITKARTE